MAQDITATDDLQKPVNVAFEETFLRVAQQNLPYFMGTQPGQLNEQAGTSTVKWRRIEQQPFTTTALTELTTTASYMMGRDSVQPTFTDVVATMSKYGQFYIINEEVDLYNPNGTADQLVSRMAESAGRGLNALHRNVVEDNFPLKYSNGTAVNQVNTIISANIIASAVQTLRVNSARTFTPMTQGADLFNTSPILSAYWGINSPYVTDDIAGLTGFVSVANYNSQVATAPGEYGYFAKAGRGVRFIESEDAGRAANAGAVGGTNVISTGGTNADVFSTVIYGQDASGTVGLGQQHIDGVYRAGENRGSFEIIQHDRGSGGTSDPYNEIRTLAHKEWYAGQILNPAWGFAIKSAATDLG